MRPLSIHRGVYRRSFTGWLLGLGGFVCTVLIRIPISHYLRFPAAIEFVPAMIFAAWFCGIEVGIAVLSLSGVTLGIFFASTPIASRLDRISDSVDLVVFLCIATLILALIRALNNALDVSERLAQEANELQQRTATLFAELQHRVANNLGFVSAVLSLERRQVAGDRTADQALAAAQDRVMTMSRIHRRFYEPRQLDRPSALHLGELCNDMISASGLRVKCRIDADDTCLRLEQLIPVSLIVSELVTNSLKHAFPETRSGVITIVLRRQDDERVLLLVADNGCGGTAGEKGRGLGATIVQRLAAQLKAEIMVETKGGRAVSLVFRPDAVQRVDDVSAAGTASRQIRRLIRA